jgi:hypothetical protein
MNTVRLFGKVAGGRSKESMIEPLLMRFISRERGIKKKPLVGDMFTPGNAVPTSNLV